MPWCKTAVTPLLTHWSYCSLALSHRCVVAYSTHLIWCRKICRGRSKSSRVHPIEWDKSLTAVFWKCPLLIFVKIRYATAIPSVTCRDLKFHYGNLISPLVNHNKILTCFERFTTKKYHNVKKVIRHTSETQCLKHGIIVSLHEAIKVHQIMNHVIYFGEYPETKDDINYRDCIVVCTYVNKCMKSQFYCSVWHYLERIAIKGYPCCH